MAHIWLIITKKPSSYRIAIPAQQSPLKRIKKSLKNKIIKIIHR